MKRMKKWLAMSLALLLALSLAACGGTVETPENTEEPETGSGTDASTSAMVEAETALENAGADEVEVPEGTDATGGVIYVQGYEWGPKEGYIV